MQIIRFSTVLAMFLIPVVGMAIPTLQVGAPAGLGDAGTYADYQPNSTDPTETDTALTEGTTLFFAGAYGPNTLKIGGRYIGAPANGLDYSAIDSNLTVFDGHDAIALAAVEDGKLAMAIANNLSLGGILPFHTSTTLSGLFPNNHDPLKDAIADFLFFDIGNFVSNSMAVPDFADETGASNGEIKSLVIAGTTNQDWVHFDLVALVTNTQGQTSVRTTFTNNPGSRDVTWKDPNTPPPNNVSEPSLLGLMGFGLIGVGMVRRQRKFA